MNTTVNTTLVAALMLASASSLAQVTLSGTMDLGVRHVRNGALGSVTSQTSGNNLTSKIVLRASEDLGSGWRAGMMLDASVAADTGNSATPFFDRQSTVGLSHAAMGEVRLGRDWVPTHLAWTALDPFTTLGIASANTFRSVFSTRALGQAFGSTAAANLQNPTLRVNNTVEYFLPANLGGVYGAAMASFDEGGLAADGATKGRGGRIGWTNGRVDVGYARFETRNAAGGREFTDQVLGASVNFGVARISVGQRRYSFGSDRLASTLVGASVPLGPGVLRLSWVGADQKGSTAELSANDASMLGLGYVYNLSKRTVVYSHAARVSNKRSAAFALVGGPATSGNPAAANYFGGQRSSGLEVGVRHNF